MGFDTSRHAEQSFYDCSWLFLFSKMWMRMPRPSRSGRRGIWIAGVKVETIQGGTNSEGDCTVSYLESHGYLATSGQIGILQDSTNACSGAPTATTSPPVATTAPRPAPTTASVPMTVCRIAGVSELQGARSCKVLFRELIPTMRSGSRNSRHIRLPVRDNRAKDDRDRSA